MTSEYLDRRTQWTPAPRPAWMAKLNDLMCGLDEAAVIPLTHDSLIDQAMVGSGLCDFGGGDWLEHFTVLMEAVEREAGLHFAGRLLTRCEMILHLQTRLQIVEGYRRFPAAAAEVVDAPLLITGYGRSGTTILFEVLAQDPQFRVAQRWEALFPYPPPETETYAVDPRIARTEAQDTLLAEMTPEFQQTHKSGARLPVESLEMEYSSFISDIYPIIFQIPSYAAYLARRSNREAIEWQRTTLKLLQLRHKARHWLMKSPSHLSHLPTILDVFPDARIIFTHRDPIVSADSVTSMMGTLYWLRTDRPWGAGDITSASLSLADARARQWDEPMAMIASGRLKQGQFANFHYAQFMADPIAAIRAVYRQLGMILSADVEAGMRAFLAARPQGQFGRHVYKETPSAAMDAERAPYREYESFFGVAREA